MEPANDPINQALGGWGLLGILAGALSLTIFSIVRGWLKPKISHDEVVTQLMGRLLDRDSLIAELRKTNEALDKRNDLLAEQIRDLVTSVHTINATLENLSRSKGV